MNVVEQMKKLDEMNSFRRKHSAYLIEKLVDVEEIDLPVENQNCEHVYQMFTIKVKKGYRDKLVFRLKKCGIEASVHFDPPVHLHPAYARYNKCQLPITEKVSETICSLPMSPGLTRFELDRIVSVIKEFYGR